MKAKPYWNPYVAGTLLGLVLLGSFVVTGKGLGASGAVKGVTAEVLHAASPTWAEEHAHIGKLFGAERSPLDTWIVLLGLGVLVGGAIGSFSAGRFKRETIQGPHIERVQRLTLAFAGGAIAGIGAQIARGCTSGQALTGGAQLALGSWVFMVAFFGAAYALAYVVRKQWI